MGYFPEYLSGFCPFYKGFVAIPAPRQAAPARRSKRR
jgi:hypothetical protein